MVSFSIRKTNTHKRSTCSSDATANPIFPGASKPDSKAAQVLPQTHCSSSGPNSPSHPKNTWPSTPAISESYFPSPSLSPASRSCYPVSTEPAGGTSPNLDQRLRLPLPDLIHHECTWH